MNAPTDRDDNHALRSNAQFQSLPEQLQHWIHASPNATADFTEFFRKNGEFDPSQEIGLPYYNPTTPPTIAVDRSTWIGLQQPGTEYAQRHLFGTLAHEIGHDRYNTGNILFTGKTAGEYVQYRAGLEAQAIFNAFPIFKDLEQHPDFKQTFPFDSIGYLSGLELGQTYKQWRNGELDDKAVVSRIAAQVPDRPYTLGGPLQDQNADGKLTHRDLYLRDYTQYVAPKLEPQASSNAPSPADPKHSDHATLEQIRAGVHTIDRGVGKNYDDMSERISRCLLAACKDNGLTRVDHVVMGTTGNIFAVEGKLHDPAHLRTFVPVEQAIRTPVEQSDEKLLAANQSIAQEQALMQTRAINSPSQSGPKLIM